MHSHVITVQERNAFVFSGNELYSRRNLVLPTAKFEYFYTFHKTPNIYHGFWHTKINTALNSPLPRPLP